MSFSFHPLGKTYQACGRCPCCVVYKTVIIFNSGTLGYTGSAGSLLADELLATQSWLVVLQACEKESEVITRKPINYIKHNNPAGRIVRSIRAFVSIDLVDMCSVFHVCTAVYKKHKCKFCLGLWVWN